MAATKKKKKVAKIRKPAKKKPAKKKKVAKGKPAVKVPEADGIAVHCAHDQILAMSKLRPHPRNPNRHEKREVLLLAKAILKQGWRAPITVSTRSGYIVRGHCRRLAAVQLKVDQVPVDFQSYATEAEELADLVADNRIAELADLDRTVLREIMLELDTGAFDMDLTGFDEVALEEIMTAAPPPDPDPPDPGTDPGQGGGDGGGSEGRVRAQVGDLKVTIDEGVGERAVTGIKAVAESQQVDMAEAVEAVLLAGIEGAK